MGNQIVQVEAKMEKRLSQTETRLEKKIKEAIFKSEELLLDEMDRYDKKNERRFAEIEQRLDTLEDIYRMTKSENETVTILLRFNEKLEKRVTKLEEIVL